MHLRLKGKKALVTGGSHGIGREIARLLKRYGVKVDIMSRDKLIIFNAETGQIPDIPYEYDILINNVGGGGTWGNKIEEFNEWEKVYEKNAGTARRLTMKCLPYMIKQGWGRVITISSIYGKEKGDKPWFVMAKVSEIALNKCLAGKYEGITFNTICPGHIDVGKGWTGGDPKDVAYLTAFLCSNKAKHINGACITIDNGESYSF